MTLRTWLAAMQRLPDERFRTKPSNELLEEYRAARDECRFRELVRRHGPAVYGRCWAAIRDETRRGELTEQAFQQTFIALDRSSRHFRSEEHLRRWLVRVAAQRASRQEMRERSRPVLSGVPIPDTAVDARVGEAIETREEIELVRCALEGLQPTAVELLRLYYFDGLTQRQVAERFGMPERTVQTQLRRGVEELRRRLAPSPLNLALLPIALVPRGAEGMSPALIEATVRAVLALPERGTGLSVLAALVSGTTGWASWRRAVVAGTIVLGGLTVGLLMWSRPAEPPPEVGPERPAVESLQDMNLRLLREDILPRVAEALRPLAGGDVKVVQTSAHGSEVECVLEAPPTATGKPLWRFRFRYCTLQRTFRADYDLLCTGHWRLLQPSRPFVLGPVGVPPFKEEVVLAVPPLEEAARTFHRFPEDPRAVAEWNNVRVLPAWTDQGELILPLHHKCVAGNSRCLFLGCGGRGIILAVNSRDRAARWACIGRYDGRDFCATDTHLYGTWAEQLWVRPASLETTGWEPIGPCPGEQLSGMNDRLYCVGADHVLWSRPAVPREAAWSRIGEVAPTTVIGAAKGEAYFCTHDRSTGFELWAGPTANREQWRRIDTCPRQLRVTSWGEELIGWAVGENRLLARPLRADSGEWQVFGRLKIAK